MDPYLENRRLWKGVHDSLIYRMLEDLQPKRQPRYIAVFEGRLLQEEPDLRIWHTYLEIRDPEDGTVVTVIELLSPWNKSAGQGQEEYRAKQRAMLLSDTNLVEIDLLRAGAHTVAVPPGKLPASDYRICTHRVARPDGFEVIRLGVREPLPRVGIPLRPGEQDVVLDLPTVFRRVYDTGVYHRLVHYREAADPPLTGSDAEWADALLREAGYR
jgi:hypothetical protein